MFQLYKNIQTYFLGQIFLELFQFKLGHFFGTPISYQEYAQFFMYILYYILTIIVAFID